MPLLDAAESMSKHRIHRVVVTRSGQAVGVVSTRDAIAAVLAQRTTTPLERIMTSPVSTISDSDTIRAGIERLDDAGVHGLVVMDNNWPIGMFTHHEALEAKNLPSMFLEAPIERVMSYETICLDIGTPLYRVAGYAIQMHVRRILAVHGRELRGVVSTLDLVRAMANQGREALS
jgi:CBS domain-containing protein